MSGLLCSVIVLNADGRRYLEPCLRALKEQMLPGVEVILLDNGSRDGSQELVRESFPEVRLIETGRNLGFCAAYNRAIRETRGPYVALLNNDTRVRPGWLSALLDAAASEPRVGAVTSKLVFADRPGVVQSAGTLLLEDGAGVDRGFGEEDRGQYDRREEVFGFCGGAALLRREALEDAGLFDELFRAYYEDTDLSWRLRLRGWKILFEPRAVVEHVHAATNREWSDYFTFHVDRNRVVMLLKDAPAGFAAASLRRLLGRTGGGPAQPGGGGRRRVRPAVHARVLLSLVWHLPRILLARARIRGRRLVPDSEVARLIVPRRAWPGPSA